MFEKITSLDIINTILIVSFSVSFIGIFFFTYVKDIEKNIVVNNLEYIVNDTVGNFKKLLSDDEIKKIKKYLDNIKLKNMAKEDEAVKNYNSELFNNTIIITIVVFLVSLVSSYFIFNKYNSSTDITFIDIISKNIILLLAIVVVEFLFVNLIPINYFSFDVNLIKKNILVEIIKNNQNRDVIKNNQKIVNDTIKTNQKLINNVIKNTQKIVNNSK